VRAGLAGAVPDTPKPGHPALARAKARVIGSRADAMEGARAAAVERGYRAIVMPDAVTGEARDAARDWFRRVKNLVGPSPAKVCVLSSGETTVTVTGAGIGGRNLEFALALADALPSMAPAVAVASAGTDGIDGSSGVAGGIVDSTTMARAFKAGLAPPGTYLAANDSLAFFAPLGDAIRTGRTDTNVGDLQVLLID
jgi:glycerate 2-kinase